MRKSSATDRLRWAHDQCPLPGSSIPSLFHTLWHAEGHNSVNSYQKLPDGYHVIVNKNRFFYWQRTFSISPPDTSSKACITLHEWIPRYEPKANSRWYVFGSNYTAAYAKLHTDYLHDWHTHAKRHLKQFSKTNCQLRLGTRDEVVSLYATSQVPKSLQAALLQTLDNHLAAHPDTISILIAEKHGQPIACLVSGDCEEAKISEYVIGAFHPDFKKDHAMVGLVNWWYQRSLVKNYTTLTFGHIEPSRAAWLPLSGNGYSFFKTHFGIERVWFPKNRWHLSLNWRAWKNT
jgi:hypothetical protein